MPLTDLQKRILAGEVGGSERAVRALTREVEWQAQKRSVPHTA